MSTTAAASELRDVIVIGAGHNGLACAAYLARAGARVTVLERAETIGGATQTTEFHPGFRNSLAAYAVSLLAPEVIDELRLADHGLRIVERPAANFWPVPGGRGLLMPNGSVERRAAVAEISPRDADRLPDYDASLAKAAGLLREFARRAPPEIAGGGIASLLEGGRLAAKLFPLDLAERRLLIDLFTKSVAEYLALWFENDLLKAAFAFDGIVGAYAAPSTPGTAYVLLHHCFGEVNGRRGAWGHAIGGMGAIAEALAGAARAAGVEIRTRAEVARVLVRDGRAVGVETQTGERLRAHTIAAAIAPKLLFRDLLPADAVDPDTRSRFLAIRSGSGTFRMNVALAGLPDFTSRPGRVMAPHHGAGIVIGPSMEYLERAWLDARMHGWSRQPVIEMLIPSAIDGSLAPPGRHVASLFVQHVAPHLPAPRTWADPTEREAMAELVIATVDAHAPGFAAAIIARQILSPLDLEQRLGLIDGDIFHGQLGLDQLYASRPVAGHAGYRMPVPGLYLCGAGAHPGGGVTGLPGRNAARRIAADLKSHRHRAF